MKKKMGWLLLTVATLWTLSCASALEPGRGTTVVLVRHGERVDDSEDAALSPLGLARAQDLADVLQRADVKALFATEFRRTQEMLQPLADRFQLKIQEVPADQPKHLVDTIFEDYEGQLVVVATHGDRIAEIMRLLGVSPEESSVDARYDDLFVVTEIGDGRASLLRLSYGVRGAETMAMPAEGSGPEPK
ncbi:MAG: phosphoglycerate mutase family protein [Acidobacteriota bacterium]|jgi:2,3-bisphosphoglycerate-dependent phosphoglycerate mutase